MNIKHHTQPQKLEKYSFLWSQGRLVIAAVALFVGGTPPLLYLNLPFSISFTILKIAWLISGAASVYLLYRWQKSGHKLFGSSDTKDMVAFFVSTISGLNLGLTGLTRTNLGMSIISNKYLYILAAVVYLVALYHLQKRWKESGQKIF